MKSLPLATSLALNLLLVLTIANIYLSDQYFRDWVSVTINPLFPFLVLTLAVGGGSGLGYLFLQRKHPDQRASLRGLQKPRISKPGISVASPISSSKVLPAGASPTTIPKQVAYAVPPPASSPRSSSTVSKQGPPTLSISPSKPPAMGTPGQSQAFPTLGRKDPSTQPAQTPSLRPEPQLPTSPPVLNQVRSVPPQWQPDSRPQLSGSGGPVVKPGQFGSQGFQPSANIPPPLTPPPTQLNRPPIPPAGSSPVPIQQKWQPPGKSVSSSPSPPSQARPEIDASQKWSPLPNRTPGTQPSPTTIVPPPQTQPRQGLQPFQPGGSPRSFPPPAAPGPFAPRPMGPMTQRPPGIPYQPLGGPSTSPRPGELGPIGVPRQFRPEPDKPAIAPPQARPLPSPQGQWTSPPPSSIRPRPPGDNPQPPIYPKPGPNEAAQPPTRATENQLKPNEQPGTGGTGSNASESPGGAGGSEMDWDTALDTILKTLRRDRIRDEQ